MPVWSHNNVFIVLSSAVFLHSLIWLVCHSSYLQLGRSSLATNTQFKLKFTAQGPLFFVEIQGITASLHQVKYLLLVVNSTMTADVLALFSHCLCNISSH